MRTVNRAISAVLYYLLFFPIKVHHIFSFVLSLLFHCHARRAPGVELQRAARFRDITWNIIAFINWRGKRRHFVRCKRVSTQHTLGALEIKKENGISQRLSLPSRRFNDLMCLLLPQFERKSIGNAADDSGEERISLYLMAPSRDCIVAWHTSQSRHSDRFIWDMRCWRSSWRLFWWLSDRMVKSKVHSIIVNYQVSACTATSTSLFHFIIKFSAAVEFFCGSSAIMLYVYSSQFWGLARVSCVSTWHSCGMQSWAMRTLKFKFKLFKFLSSSLCANFFPLPQTLPRLLLISIFAQKSASFAFHAACTSFGNLP